MAVADAWSEYVARIEEAPASGTVRGVFFNEILRLVPLLRASRRPRYLPFSKYPLREFMQLLVDGARIAHPMKSPESALSLLGLTTYATFASSMAGASLLASPAYHQGRVLELAPRAYPLALEPGGVEVVSYCSDEAVVKLRDVWPFPESFHRGVWLGAMQALGVTGSVDVIRHGWCHVDFHLRWGPG